MGDHVALALQRENHCTKISGEGNPPEMPSFDEGFGYHHKGFQPRRINNTLIPGEVPEPCFPGDLSSSEWPHWGPLETVMARPLFS